MKTVTPGGGGSYKFKIRLAKNYSSPSLFNLFRDAGQMKSEEATSPTTGNKMKMISKITTELERAIILEFRSKKLTQITESDVFC